LIDEFDGDIRAAAKRLAMLPFPLTERTCLLGYNPNTRNCLATSTSSRPRRSKWPS
jgi:hypothetical protein